MNKINFSSASTFKLGILSLALFAASGAYAAETTVAGTGGSVNPRSATDTLANGVATSGPSNSSDTAQLSVSRYNGSGVLTGVSFAVGVGSQNLTFTANNNGVAGSAFARGSVSLGGVTATQDSGSKAVSGLTSTNYKTATLDSYTVTGAANTQAQLDAFYGTGSVTGTVSERLYANLTAPSSSGRSITVNNITNNNDNSSSNPTASVAATYTYLNHANGSFGSSSVDTNVLNYSFGDVANGATPTAYAFSLYNLAGSYGLQVVSAVYTGDALFTLTGITGIPTLAATESTAGSVNFGPTTVAGAHSGFWTIVVADTNGLGANKNTVSTDTLRLNVSANVLAPVTPVPEPETYAMMLAGLMMMGTIARRRNKKQG